LRQRGEFGGTRLLCGFSLGSAGGVRVIHGDPLEALLFECRVLTCGVARIPI
jgi:hypothetical protein